MMKKTFTQLFLVLLSLVMLMGCKKDNDSPSAFIEGKWFQVKERKIVFVNNVEVDDLTITDFNNVNYMDFKKGGTVRRYENKGIVLNVGDTYQYLSSMVYPEPLDENYKYSIDGQYLTLTQGSYSVKCIFKRPTESTFTLQLENSFNDNGKAIKMNNEIEFKKQ